MICMLNADEFCRSALLQPLQAVTEPRAWPGPGVDSSRTLAPDVASYLKVLAGGQIWKVSIHRNG